MDEPEKTMSDWIWEAIDRIVHKEEMDFAYDMHEGMWGVPCGPTLTMVYPTKMIGIQVRMEPPPQFTKSLTEQQLACIVYPNHSRDAALANYRAGREIYDTNGDLW